MYRFCLFLFFRRQSLFPRRSLVVLSLLTAEESSCWAPSTGGPPGDHGVQDPPRPGWLLARSRDAPAPCFPAPGASDTLLVHPFRSAPRLPSFGTRGPLRILKRPCNSLIILAEQARTAPGGRKRGDRSALRGGARRSPARGAARIFRWATPRFRGTCRNEGGAGGGSWTAGPACAAGRGGRWHETGGRRADVSSGWAADHQLA